jgi:hypothetical protein
MLLLLVVPTLLAAKGDYIHLSLDLKNHTPFSVLRYEITDRGPASSGVHRRVLAGTQEFLQGMTLFTQAEATSLWQELRQLKATTLPSASKKTREVGLLWSFVMQLDGKTHRFRVRDPINQKDRRYWQLFNRVKTMVKRGTGALPFRNVYFPQGKYGWFHVQSIPTARVYVDGFDTKLETPVYLYKLAVGKHQISLRATDSGIKKHFEVKIAPMSHRRLNADLR